MKEKNLVLERSKLIIINRYLMNLLNSPYELTNKEMKERYKEFIKNLDRNNTKPKDYYESDKEKDYIIEEVKYYGGGFGTSIVGSLKFNDGEKSRYLALSFFDFFSEFYESNVDLFELLTDPNLDEEQHDNLYTEYGISIFEDIKFDFEGTNGTYESIEKTKHYNVGKLIKFVMALVFLDYKETEDLIELSINNHISDIFLPVTNDQVIFYKWIDSLDK